MMMEDEVTISFFKNVTTNIILILFLITLAACKSKPSKDESVDYENARSIPSLQVPAADEKATKR